MVRICCNPTCDREITACFGTTNAGDIVEFWEGTRPASRVRELCPHCATYLILATSTIPPEGWSPYFAAFGFS